MSSDMTFHQVVVSEIADEVPAVVSLKLERRNGQPMAPFEPGAHVELQIPNGARRSYSICSDPSDRSHYMLGVLREPESKGGSAYIHEALEPGDTLLMSDPKSSFRLAEDATKHVFIAGGIAPKLLPLADRPTVKAVFAGKPPMEDLAARFALHIITAQDAAEQGLAAIAANLPRFGLDDPKRLWFG